MPRDSLLHRVRLLARRSGVDFHRWPTQDPAYAAFRAMTRNRPDVIFDVGANDGGFARDCRSFGFSGRIVSFEPGSAAFARLRDASAADPLWEVHNFGLGGSSGMRELNIAANSGASSSFLPMTSTHERAAVHATYTHTEKVQVRTLDEVAADVASTWQRPCLKIDTQGFEQDVLEGATETLRGAATVRLELSLTPLYEGAWDWLEAIHWFRERGMRLVGVVPGFTDPETGDLLQFDGVFAKD